MKAYLIYNDTTGQIITNGTIADISYLTPPAGHTIAYGTAQSGIDYWDGAKAVTMQKLQDVITFSQFTIDIDSAETITISGIPVGTTVTSYGSAGLKTSSLINDGLIIYNTDKPGQHLFSFSHPQYVMWGDVEVTAV